MGIIALATTLGDCQSGAKDLAIAERMSAFASVKVPQVIDKGRVNPNADIRRRSLTFASILATLAQEMAQDKEPVLTLGNKLSPAFVKVAAHSSRTRSDERRSEPGSSRSWVQRIVIHGRRRTFGLGGYPLLRLREARRVAFENRALAQRGGDPLALRAWRDVPNFATATAAVIDIQAGVWKDGASRADSGSRRWALGACMTDEMSLWVPIAVDDGWHDVTTVGEPT